MFIKKIILSITIIIFIFFNSVLSFASEQVKRTIIVVYDSDDKKSIKHTLAHRFLQMPLNHLGLKVEYFDIKNSLPDFSNRDDVRGVVSWFSRGFGMGNPNSYIEWSNDVISQGKKFLVVGNPAIYFDKKEKMTSVSYINKFFKNLGLEYTGSWQDITYDVDIIYKDENIVSFEKKMSQSIPPFHVLLKIDKNIKEYMIIENFEGYHIPVILSNKNGGYIADGFAFFYQGGQKEYASGWHINPIKYLREVFQTDDIIKLDTTTLAGRRIYYSHIDGDGWNNMSRLEEHRKKIILASEVILDKIFKKYPDMPVSVAPIAADLDKDWVAQEDSGKIAKEIFKLPHIEMASHTYSHPFFWEFFADGDPEKERPFLSRYRDGGWEPVFGKKILNFLLPKSLNLDQYDLKKMGSDIDFEIPRAFAKEKFSMAKEIFGSIKKIEEFAPPGKKVQILMWSGNTSPSEEALRMVREAGIVNINGGDSRFDKEYDSLGWVAPNGKKIGNEYQVYASNSNENTYTNLWTDRFFGFRFLLNTIKNTETPIRLKPFNIYYHMYSGERRASLNALVNNLEYARTRFLIPITASNYAKIIKGFLDAKIIKLEDGSWQIKDRGDLQTLRLDNAVFDSVDFENSKGIIGQKYYQSSLYIYLDKNIEDIIIKVKENPTYYKMQVTENPYIIDSNWQIYNYQSDDNNIKFTAQGFGDLDIKFSVKNNDNYNLFFQDKLIIKNKAKDNILHLNAKLNAISPIDIKIVKN